jgi:hypothetical protein
MPRATAADAQFKPQSLDYHTTACIPPAHVAAACQPAATAATAAAIAAATAERLLSTNCPAPVQQQCKGGRQVGQPPQPLAEVQQRVCSNTVLRVQVGTPQQAQHTHSSSGSSSSSTGQHTRQVDLNPVLVCHDACILVVCTCVGMQLLLLLVSPRWLHHCWSARLGSCMSAGLQRKGVHGEHQGATIMHAASTC